MAYGSRSPHVVGAHLYAKFGYDEAVGHISSKLTASDQTDHSFWTQVLEELEMIQADEMNGVHPCAALPPTEMSRTIKENKAAIKLPN